MADLSDRMRLALCMGVVDVARAYLVGVQGELDPIRDKPVLMHLDVVISDLELAITKAGLAETRQLQAAE